jgi:hypothetical protein
VEAQPQRLNCFLVPRRNGASPRQSFPPRVTIPANTQGTYMSTLSFAPTIKVFPCPNCRETINTSMQQCSFCGTPIDAAAAEASAEFTSRVSAAVSDASYLSILGFALISFFVILFIPLLGLMGAVGLWFLRIAIPVMVVRWWIRYGKLKTTDPDFTKARRRAIIVSTVAVFLLCDTGYTVIHRSTPSSATVQQPDGTTIRVSAPPQR